MLAHRLAERTEHDAELAELLLHRRPNAHRIEDRVDGHAGEKLLLVERNPQLLIGAKQLGVHVVQRLQRRHGLRRRVVRERLIVDGLVADVGPVRLLHRQPTAVRLEAPLEQPLGLFLLRRDSADHRLVQTGGQRVRLDVGHEAVLVFAIDQRIN
jgi:hypothetical protein